MRMHSFIHMFIDTCTDTASVCRGQFASNWPKTILYLACCVEPFRCAHFFNTNFKVKNILQTIINLYSKYPLENCQFWMIARAHTQYPYLDTNSRTSFIIIRINAERHKTHKHCSPPINFNFFIPCLNIYWNAVRIDFGVFCLYDQHITILQLIWNLNKFYSCKCSFLCSVFGQWRVHKLWHMQLFCFPFSSLKHNFIVWFCRSFFFERKNTNLRIMFTFKMQNALKFIAVFWCVFRCLGYCKCIVAMRFNENSCSKFYVHSHFVNGLKWVWVCVHCVCDEEKGVFHRLP